MRVIAGSKRRLLLDTPEGLGTRPTQDRIKETLFNMIGPDVYDGVFLDLFAGSGQMGIEALSRGAKKCVFVEQDKNAYTVIESNIKKTDFEDSSLLLREDVFSALSKITSHESFDFVFMDPPYNKLIEKRVLETMANMDSITEDTLIIVEASLDTDFSYTKELGFSIIKEKNYKTNKHIFIKKA